MERQRFFHLSCSSHFPFQFHRFFSHCNYTAKPIMNTSNHFESSSVHSSLTEGFERNSGKALLQELYKLFAMMSFQDPATSDSNSSKKLLNHHKASKIVKSHYGASSGEADIVLYCNKPTEPYRPPSQDYHHKIFPFTITGATFNSTPDWAIAIESLRAAEVYKHPLTPTNSISLIGKDSSHDAHRATANLYVVVEASYSTTNVVRKLKQLELQLAYLVIKYHLLRNPSGGTTVPRKHEAFQIFIANEVLKLIAFAGISLALPATPTLLRTVQVFLNDGQNDLPAVQSLLKNGRLLYFPGITYPARLNALEEKQGELKGEVKELRGEVEELRGEVKELRGEVEELRGEVKELRREVKKSRGELKGLRKAMRKDAELLRKERREEVKILGEKIDKMYSHMMTSASDKS
ncbi:hypothetical protein BC829DRAFT_260159 [Chytridium lagenaria]|nr:hypothetical protein BC829DRAFT_260159 [Chytridium lagenaria]